MTTNESKEQQQKKNKKNITKAAFGNPKLTRPDRPAT